MRFPNLATGFPNLAAAFSECGLFLILDFGFFFVVLSTRKQRKKSLTGETDVIAIFHWRCPNLAAAFSEFGNGVFRMRAFSSIEFFVPETEEEAFRK